MINNSEILLLWAGGLWFCGGVCIFVWSLFTALAWFWVWVLWVVVLFENSIVCHLTKMNYF